MQRLLGVMESKRIDNNDKIIIFNVVPETIARINSYWKHYREFGNIHGFKPILKIKKDKLTILKVKIKKNAKNIEKSKFQNMLPRASRRLLGGPWSLHTLSGGLTCQNKIFDFFEFSRILFHFFYFCF